jgi:PAS domain S-box-containing protein
MGTRETARSTTSSWQRFRMIADNSSDVVYETTPDGIIQWVSPTVESLLGYRPVDFRGTSARDYVHPDDLGMVNQLRQQVYAGAELDEIPCRFRTADGTYRSCTVRARPVRDAEGAITGAVMALRDAHLQAATLRALTTLSRANGVLVRERTEQDLLRETCKSIVSTGQYRVAWYGRKVHDEAHSIDKLAVEGPAAEGILTSTTYWSDDYREVGLTGPAIITGRTQVLNNVGTAARTEPWHAVSDRFTLRSGIAIPVRMFGEIDGALIVYSDELGTFDDVAQQIFEDLAADLGYGLERLAEAEELTEIRLREVAHSERLSGILDAQLDPLVLLQAVRDETGRIVDLRYVEANASALAYNGRTAEEQLGQLFTVIHPSLAGNGLTQRYFDVVETGEPVILDDYSYANPNVGGETRRYDIRAMKCGDGVTLTWRDVTERYAVQQRISESEHRYRVLTENASDVVWETAADGTMAWVSESVVRVLGWHPDQLLGRSTLELIHPEHRERAAHNRDKVAMGLTVREEYRVLTADGGYRWMALTAQRTHREGRVLRIVSLRDIHDEILGRARLAHAALHDPLTGLVNREEIRRRVHARLDADAGLVCVLKIGVDGLARVNEGLGHEAGDELLATVAERVVDVIGDVDLVARGTGDELIVLLVDQSDGAAAGDVADRLREAVRHPVVLGGAGAPADGVGRHRDVRHHGIARRRAPHQHRRHGDARGQAAGPGPHRVRRRRAGRRRRTPPRGRGPPAPGDPPRRAPPVVPAGRGDRQRPGDRVRGARTVVPSRRHDRAAERLPPGRRAQRADRRPRPVDPAAVGRRAADAAARSARGGERVGRIAGRPDVPGARRGAPRGVGCGTGEARPRDHRDRAAPGAQGCPHDGGAARRGRHPLVRRRLRHGLLLDRAPARPARGRPETGPLVHRRDRRGRRDLHPAGAGAGRSRRRSGPRHGRRGHRDRGGGGLPVGAGVEARPGLAVREGRPAARAGLRVRAAAAQRQVARVRRATVVACSAPGWARWSRAASFARRR